MPASWNDYLDDIRTRGTAALRDRREQRRQGIGLAPSPGAYQQMQAYRQQTAPTTWGSRATNTESKRGFGTGQFDEGYYSGFGTVGMLEDAVRGLARSYSDRDRMEAARLGQEALDEQERISGMYGDATTDFWREYARGTRESFAEPFEIGQRFIDRRQDATEPQEGTEDPYRRLVEAGQPGSGGMWWGRDAGERQSVQEAEAWDAARRQFAPPERDDAEGGIFDRLVGAAAQAGQEDARRRAFEETPGTGVMWVGREAYEGPRSLLGPAPGPDPLEGYLTRGGEVVSDEPQRLVPGSALAQRRDYMEDQLNPWLAESISPWLEQQDFAEQLAQVPMDVYAQDAAAEYGVDPNAALGMFGVAESNKAWKDQRDYDSIRENGMPWGEYQGMLEDQERQARAEQGQAIEDAEEAALDAMNEEIWQEFRTSGTALAADAGLELPQLYEVLASDQFVQVQDKLNEAVNDGLDEYEIEDVFHRLGQEFDPAVVRVGYELNRMRLPPGLGL